MLLKWFRGKFSLIKYVNMLETRLRHITSEKEVDDMFWFNIAQDSQCKNMKLIRKMNQRTKESMKKEQYNYVKRLEDEIERWERERDCRQRQEIIYDEKIRQLENENKELRWKLEVYLNTVRKEI